MPAGNPMATIRVLGATVIMGALFGYITAVILPLFNATGGLWTIVPILFAIIPVAFGVLYAFAF
jgi:hypothetical protein